MELLNSWTYVSDAVMGGVSEGSILRGSFHGRLATRLIGRVSLENNGGFIQMGINLADGIGVFDASNWAGVEIEVRGNGEIYEVRIRTDELARPWESFRAEFRAPDNWTKVKILFSKLMSHRTKIQFNPRRLRRIGVLGFGREFEVDISVSAIRLFH